MSDERVTLHTVILALAVFLGSGLIFVPLIILLFVSWVTTTLSIALFPFLLLSFFSVSSRANVLNGAGPIFYLLRLWTAFFLIVANGPMNLLIMLHTISNPHLATENHFFFLILFLSIATSSVICFGVLYSTYGIKEVATGANTNLLSDGLYFSIITWTTVGFGDFIPASKMSRRLAAYEAILGYFTMASIFSLAVVMLSGRQ